MPTSRRRRHGGLTTFYPVIIGGVALVALLLVIQRQSDPAEGAADAAVDAAVDGHQDAEAPVELLTRDWQIEGLTELPSTDDLKACMERAGYPRARVMSADKVRLISERRLPDPIALRASAEPGGPVTLATPVQRSRPVALAFHFVVADCLKAEGRAVIDPVLGTRAGPEDWPGPTPSGGVPIDRLLGLKPFPGGLITVGLSALGLPELALAGLEETASEDDRAKAERTLQVAAQVMVVSGLPTDGALPLSAGVTAGIASEAQARKTPWYPAQPPQAGDAEQQARVWLVTPGSEPPTPLAGRVPLPDLEPEAETPEPPAPEPPTAATPRTRRRPRRNPLGTEVPRARPRRRRPPVEFKPDYR